MSERREESREREGGKDRNKEGGKNPLIKLKGVSRREEYSEKSL